MPSKCNKIIKISWRIFKTGCKKDYREKGLRK
jgi:hypothetical protein